MDALLSAALGACTLPRWLWLVASLRLFSAALGYAFPSRLFGETLETQLFDGGPRRRSSQPPPPPFTPLASRLFAQWTLVSCAVCAAAAVDGSPRTLWPCLFTFALALAFFTSEVFVFGTVSLKAASRPAVVASVSCAWIALELAAQRSGAGGGAKA